MNIAKSSTIPITGDTPLHFFVITMIVIMETVFRPFYHFLPETTLPDIV